MAYEAFWRFRRSCSAARDAAVLTLAPRAAHRGSRPGSPLWPSIESQGRSIGDRSAPRCCDSPPMAGSRPRLPLGRQPTTAPRSAQTTRIRFPGSGSWCENRSTIAELRQQQRKLTALLVGGRGPRRRATAPIRRPYARQATQNRRSSTGAMTGAGLNDQLSAPLLLLLNKGRWPVARRPRGSRPSRKSGSIGSKRAHHPTYTLKPEELVISSSSTAGRACRRRHGCALSRR